MSPKTDGKIFRKPSNNIPKIILMIDEPVTDIPSSFVFVGRSYYIRPRSKFKLNILHELETDRKTDRKKISLTPLFIFLLSSIGKVKTYLKYYLFSFCLNVVIVIVIVIVIIYLNTSRF